MKRGVTRLFPNGSRENIMSVRVQSTCAGTIQIRLPFPARIWISPSILKSALGSLQSVQGIQELHSRFSELLRLAPVLRGFDRKSDSVNRNSRLICHLELKWRWSQLGFSFNHPDELVNNFRSHHLSFLPGNLSVQSAAHLVLNGAPSQ